MKWVAHDPCFSKLLKSNWPTIDTAIKLCSQSIYRYRKTTKIPLVYGLGFDLFFFFLLLLMKTSNLTIKRAVKIPWACFASHALRALLGTKMDSPARFSVHTQNKKSTGLVQFTSDWLPRSINVVSVLSRYQSNGLFCISNLQKLVCSNPHRHLESLKKSFQKDLPINRDRSYGLLLKTLLKYFPSA